VRFAKLVASHHREGVRSNESAHSRPKVLALAHSDESTKWPRNDTFAGTPLLSSPRSQDGMVLTDDVRAAHQSLETLYVGA
jgi:hypothetical protein